MDALAYEIKARIISEISHDTRIDRPAQRKCLKALRLSCRAWCEIPLWYLFNCIELSLWGSGLNHLHALSQSPHIARHISELSFSISFNIAEPHPAPFSRTSQRKTSVGFWQEQDDSAEGKSRFRKILKKPLPSSRRRSSVARDIARLSISAPSSSQDVDTLVKKFIASARATVAANLGRTKYEASTGLPPLLLQLCSLLSTAFSGLPSLKLLRIKTQTQTDFITSFTHGHALQFSPVFGTFSSMSDHITTTILRAWTQSKLNLSQLVLEAGSPFGLTRFLTEFDQDHITRRYSVATANPIPANALVSTLTAKLSHLQRLTLNYDSGHSSPHDNEISFRIARRNIDWNHSLADILSLCPSLRHLALTRINPDLDMNPATQFKLDATALTQSSTPATVQAFPFKLDSLIVGGFNATYPNLTLFLAAVNGSHKWHYIPTATLQELVIYSMKLEGGTWRQVFTEIRKNLRLKRFTIMPGDYLDTEGYWHVEPSANLEVKEDYSFKVRVERWLASGVAGNEPRVQEESEDEEDVDVDVFSNEVDYTPQADGRVMAMMYHRRR